VFDVVAVSRDGEPDFPQMEPNGQLAEEAERYVVAA
jgi:hypothetical protein